MPEFRGSAEHELIEFNDGELVFRFQTPGDHLILGQRSLFKHARNLSGYNSRVVGIQTDRSYNGWRRRSLAGIGYGHVLVNGFLKEIDTGSLPDVVIGEPYVIPGIATGDDCPVTAVYIDYSKRGQDIKPDVEMDCPSPLTVMRGVLEHALHVSEGIDFTQEGYVF